MAPELSSQMVLVVRADGYYWDGLGWNVRGKLFLSVAAATRSLHEAGEDCAKVEIIQNEKIQLNKHATTQKFSRRQPQTC